MSAFGREVVTAIATEGGSPLGAIEAQWPALPQHRLRRCTSVTVVRHEAVHLVRSAIVKRCEPVNITRLRCSRLFAAASCCRRNSFSAISDVRERNCRTTNPTRAPSIAAEYQEERAP